MCFCKPQPQFKLLLKRDWFNTNFIEPPIYLNKYWNCIFYNWKIRKKTSMKENLGWLAINTWKCFLIFECLVELTIILKVSNTNSMEDDLNNWKFAKYNFSNYDSSLVMPKSGIWLTILAKPQQAKPSHAKPELSRCQPQS